MYFYSNQVESINRDRLITNERLLQNTVTRSLADDIAQHRQTLQMMLANLSSAIQVNSGGDISAEHVEAPELRALLENFVSSSDDLAYVGTCAAEPCGWLFLDQTKNHRRRWCEMGPAETVTRPGGITGGKNDEAGASDDFDYRLPFCLFSIRITDSVSPFFSATSRCSGRVPRRPCPDRNGTRRATRTS